MTRKPLTLPTSGPTRAQHARRVKTLRVTNWAKKGLKSVMRPSKDPLR